MKVRFVEGLVFATKTYTVQQTHASFSADFSFSKHLLNSRDFSILWMPSDVFLHDLNYAISPGHLRAVRRSAAIVSVSDHRTGLEEKMRR